MILMIFCIFLIRLNHACGAAHVKTETLVYPKLLESRSLSDEHVIRINHDLTLKLEKSSPLTEEFLLRTYHGDVQKDTYYDGRYLEEDIYHDVGTMASVHVTFEDGIKVEGIIGSTLRIKPSELHQRSEDGNFPHVLYEIEDRRDGLHHDYISGFENSSLVTERVDISQVPKIYPEVFILTDSLFYANFQDKKKMCRYLALTLNAANLRYLSVSNPAVRLKLRGIELISGNKERFLHRVSSTWVDGLKTLYAMRTFVNQSKSEYGTYDIVYYVTGYDMVTPMQTYYDQGVRGYAFIAGACSYDKVGMGEDDGATYAGVHVMTHELGHSLGCPHDGDRAPPNKPGFYGSTQCPWNEGYIMSYVRNGPNYYKFSWCCNYQITQLASSPAGQCLLKINAVTRLDKKRSQLPGQEVSRTNLCKRSFPKVQETYFMPEHGTKDCKIQCFMPSRLYGYNTYLEIDLVDSSRCRNGTTDVCINGRCRRKAKKYGQDAVP